MRPPPDGAPRVAPHLLHVPRLHPYLHTRTGTAPAVRSAIFTGPQYRLSRLRSFLLATNTSPSPTVRQPVRCGSRSPPAAVYTRPSDSHTISPPPSAAHT